MNAKKGAIVLILMLVFISGCNSSVIDQKTAECIASKSKIYIASGCFACAQQENIFGDYFKLLNAVDCKIEPQKCVQANITAVPTWAYNEKHYDGVHTIEELKEIMDC